MFLYDSQGLPDGSPIPTIGSHQAVQHMRGAACIVSVAVTQTSRADAVAAADDNQRSCDIALQAARLLEPKLPP